MRIRFLSVAMVFLMAAPNVALATTSIFPEAQGSTGWTMDFCKDSVTGNLRQCTYLLDPATALPFSPFPAGGSIGNAAFGITGAIPPGGNVIGGVTQSGTWSVTQSGTWNIGTITTLPALVLAASASTIGTVNLGTLNGAATAAGVAAVNTTLGTPMQQTGGSVTSLSSNAITNPTSVLTRPANTTAYASGQLIGNSTTGGSVVVPSFAIANTAGGAIITRLRLRTNATVGWGNALIAVNLWTTAPTYTNGDGGAYAPVGVTGWIGNFQVTLLLVGDGFAGGALPNGANEIMVKLASGTSIFWDMQILSTATPISGQTFTLTAELLN